MRISKLHLHAFGPFTGRELDFGPAARSLVLICGPNEAGKSATLRAISDLRFGIPIQTTDNFVHANPDMRIGGVFVDRAGKEHRVARRKGRTSTLTYDDGSVDTSTARPVSAEVEALITSGLSLDEYKMMFGLDHQRLRDGGEALRKGEGDVGAALFEASAGVRSIPDVLDKMDQHARTFFMPGSRAKNAAINIALKTYEDKHAELKRSLVRPAQWIELNKNHQIALAEVLRIEQQALQLTGRLFLIKELRAVAQPMGALDQALNVLEELKDARILAESASLDRTAASTALAVAQAAAGAASEEADRLRLSVDAISPDNRILDAAAAIDRVAASSEALDAARRDLAEATLEAEAEGQRLKALCGKIDASLTVEAVIRAVPTGAIRAEVESKLRLFERTAQALEQHRGSSNSTVAADTAEGNTVLPTPESRMALLAAQGEVTRSDATIKTLASLPGEIKAAERSLATTLVDLGLTIVDELKTARPLSDAEISSAISDGENNTTRQQGLEKRIGEIGGAIAVLKASRQTLLAAGLVPTRDDVSAAREHRDAGWDLVRGKYVEAMDQPVDHYTKGRPLPEVYQEAVRAADDLVDGLASDTARASELQARIREQASLEEDLAKLTMELTQLQEARQRQEHLWLVNLDASHLPPQSAKALAEWQALLRRARETSEIIQSKADQLEQAQVTETALRNVLMAAILGTAIATPTGEATLSALVCMSVEVEAEIKRRETAIATAAGERSEREKQQQRWETRESELGDLLAQAKAEVAPLLKGLYLSGMPDPSVVRARLDELDALSACGQKLGTADSRKRKAQERIAAFENQVRQVASACGEEEAPDPRLTVDSLSKRLLTARESEKRLALARQALENAQQRHSEQLELAGKQTRLLTALCTSAGADDPGLLPEIEERSRRKRAAQAEADRNRLYIGTASQRPTADLKALLQEHDPALLVLEEEKCNRELQALQTLQTEARARESESKRDLDAIDSDDAAARLREEMEVAGASVRANLGPWIRSRLAHAVMGEALRRFRDRAQGPMLKAASNYFQQMTGGEFLRLLSEDVDEELVLVAERKSGARITVDKMSEGTRDQLYLALRLAALEVRRNAGVNMPLILDDVLATSDDRRASLMLKALAEFSRDSQVIVLTHHAHLIGVAQRSVPDDLLTVVNL